MTRFITLGFDITFITRGSLISFIPRSKMIRLRLMMRRVMACASHRVNSRPIVASYYFSRPRSAVDLLHAHTRDPPPLDGPGPRRQSRRALVGGHRPRQGSGE